MRSHVKLLSKCQLGMTFIRLSTKPWNCMNKTGNKKSPRVVQESIVLRQLFSLRLSEADGPHFHTTGARNRKVWREGALLGPVSLKTTSSKLAKSSDKRLCGLYLDSIWTRPIRIDLLTFILFSNSWNMEFVNIIQK